MVSCPWLPASTTCHTPCLLCTLLALLYAFRCRVQRWAPLRAVWKHRTLPSLTWWAQEELQAAGQGQQRPPPVLKFRAAGSTEWRHPCALLPGLHVAAPSSGSSGRTTPRAGEDPEADTEAQLGEVHVSKCCATTRILLLPAAAAAVPAAAAAAVAAEQAEEEEAAAAARPIPLRLEVRLAQLQLCLWDDERRRLLPGGGTSSGGGGGSPLGRELFSLSLQQLDMQLSRSYFVAAGCSGTTGGAGAQPHAWQRQALAVLAARFSAAALQLDSYLPASEQRVLLTSLPVDDVGHGAPRRTRRGPPLQLALEVHHCLPASEGGADGGGGMSFRKAWVHDLLVQLPTLAAAADDELLLFAERLSGLMSAADGSRQSSTGGDEGTAGGAGASSVGSVSPRHAAAGGAATQPASRMDLLQQSLAAEAAGAAASRLYIEQAVVEAGEGTPCLPCWPAQHHQVARCGCPSARFRCAGHPAACWPPPLLSAVTSAHAPSPPPLQCACFWTHTSLQAPQGCRWRSTPIAPPSPSPASPHTTCCSGLLGSSSGLRQPAPGC